jgi:Ser/Thr protein kinase RdoA (MazF antagonist)
VSDPTPPAAVLAQYGLQASEAHPVGGTAGGAWKLTAPPACFFLRRRGKRTATEARARFDLGLRRFLADRGFPTQVPLRSTAGHDQVHCLGEVFELYRWVDGELLTATGRVAARDVVATLLAAFHRVAAAYAEPCERLVPQFALHAWPGPGSPHFDDPLTQTQVLDFARAGERDPARIGRLNQALERVRWLAAAYGPLLETLPLYTIHGDFTSANVLFTPSGEIAGLFDFDWAWRDTRVRDVADGALFFGAEPAAALDPGDIWSLTRCPRLDTGGMAAFVEAYGRELPLTRPERSAIPLAILARWVSMRLENAPKVPLARQVEFLLREFEAPFEWYESEGHRLAS